MKPFATDPEGDMELNKQGTEGTKTPEHLLMHQVPEAIEFLDGPIRMKEQPYGSVHFES